MPFKSTDNQTFFPQNKMGKKYEALFLGLFDHHPMIHSTQLHVKVQAIAVGHGTNPSSARPHSHPVPPQKQTNPSEPRTLPLIRCARSNPRPPLQTSRSRSPNTPPPPLPHTQPDFPSPPPAPRRSTAPLAVARPRLPRADPLLTVPSASLCSPYPSSSSPAAWIASAHFAASFLPPRPSVSWRADVRVLAGDGDASGLTD